MLYWNSGLSWRDLTSLLDSDNENQGMINKLLQKIPKENGASPDETLDKSILFGLRRLPMCLH